MDDRGVGLTAAKLIGRATRNPAMVDVSPVILIRHHIVSKYHLAPVLVLIMLVGMRGQADWHQR
jgi:hypothetical protein